MPPSDAPSLSAPLPYAQKPPAALATIGRVLAMSLPLMIGAVITSALNLGKIAILARSGHAEALGTLSLLQPAFILALAVMEGLAITNQVFSARSKFNWPRRGIVRSSRYLALLGVALLGTVALAAFALDRWVSFSDAAVRETLHHLPLYLLSLLSFVVFDVYYGALRGQGKLLHSLLPFAGLAAIDIAVTSVLVLKYGWGFDAVLVGNLAGPLAMLPILVWLLHRVAGNGVEVPAGAVRARLAQLLVVVGGPLAASILAGSVSAALIFPALADLGRENAAGFMVVMRFRILFMIPAIAFGSVIAILMNQEAESDTPTQRLRYLIVGVPVLLAAYVGLTWALPYFAQPVLDLLLSQRSDGAQLRTATASILGALQVTFFLVAGAAMLQVILEQLERAPQVLLITLLTEAATVAAVFYALRNGGDLADVLQILRVVAAVSFALLGLLLIALYVRMRRADAV